MGCHQRNALKSLEQGNSIFARYQIIEFCTPTLAADVYAWTKKK
jgi:hypothetical protein